MVQDQLTDYISSQIKLGVSRDSIKSALVSAGWVSADVEDTLKKIEGGTPASAQSATSAAMGVKPVGATMATAASSSPAKMGEIGSKMGGPQMIRVSDLVSSPASSAAAHASMASSPASVASSTVAAVTTAKTSSAQFGGKISGNTFEASPTGGTSAVAAMHGGMNAGGGSKMMLTWIIAGVLVIIFAGAAWYFYSANAGLAMQVSSLTSQSNSVATQLSTLKSQLDSSTTALTSQVASLTSDNADLALELSFYVVPVGGSASTTSVTISGLLSGGTGKTPYVITTSRGARIFIANTADATVSTELKPLMGSTVQISGMYVPGSDQITADSVSSSTSQ